MSFINDSILLLINILHIIVIIFVLCAPFSGSNYLIFMHTIIVPFIMLHWVLNNNTCSLTVMEKYVREKAYGTTPSDEECFTYKFIAPIYDFNKNHETFTYFTYIATFGLWSISVYNLIDRIHTGKISGIEDLAKL
jgi:hypothetical protein